MINRVPMKPTSVGFFMRIYKKTRARRARGLHSGSDSSQQQTPALVHRCTSFPVASMSTYGCVSSRNCLNFSSMTHFENCTCISNRPSSRLGVPQITYGNLLYSASLKLLIPKSVPSITIAYFLPIANSSYIFMKISSVLN